MGSRHTSAVALAAALAAAACTGTIGDGGGDDAVGDDDPGAPDAAGAPDAPAGPDAPPPDEPAALTGITEAHNQVRAMVGQAPLTWDPALAAIAQGWAEQCIDQTAPAGLIDHNPDRSDTYPGYVGENIYGSGGTSTGPQAVALWASEGQYYDVATNTCTGSPYGTCGHYTQVVWGTTTKVGCGVHACAGLQYGYSIVCNYAPGGNSGGPPY